MAGEVWYMEELTVELDDETAAWLESIAVTQKKTISEIIGEMIEKVRGSSRTVERTPT